MVAVLDQLEFTQLVTSIDGLSPVGAAAILAETGDLHRFTSARAVVKHAGLAPRERMSGTFTGRARLTGAGRPRLRVAAWRAVLGMPAKQPGVRRPLPPPDHPRTQQAHPHPGPDRRGRGDPAPAVRRRRPPARPGTRPSPLTAPAGWRSLRHNPIRDPPSREAHATQELGRGEPSAALRTLAVSVGHHRPSRPVVDTTRSHAAEHSSITAMQGPTTGHGQAAQPLTLNTSR